MKRLFTTILVAIVATSAMAQSDDFGLWTSINADADLSKKWSVSLGTEMRFEDKVSKVTRSGFDFSATYKPFKFLRFGLGYVYMRDRYAGETKANYSTDENGNEYLNGYNSDPSFRRDKNRVFFQITGRHKIGRFTVSLRERLQYTHLQPVTNMRTRYRNVELNEAEAELYNLSGETVYTVEDQGTTRYFSEQPVFFNDDYYGCTTAPHLKNSKHRLYLRSRLQVAYNIKGLPLEPYASFEISNDLRKGFTMQKRRWIVGLDYTIKKRHTFGLSYIYSNGVDDDDEGNLHAVSVGYTIKI